MISTPKLSASITDRLSGVVSATIIAGSLLLGWCVFLISTALLGDWNDRLNDSFFLVRYWLKGPEKMASVVGHVDLTDASAHELHMDYGDRRYFGRLIKVLADAGVESIVFDIIFPEPGLPDGDRIFSNASRNARTVYLPAILRPVADNAAFGPPVADPDMVRSWIWRPRILRRGHPIRSEDAILNFTELAMSARGIGQINIDPDPDGVLRRIPLLVEYRGGFAPSLALRAACDALGVQPDRIEVTFGSCIRLPSAHFADGKVQDMYVPIDSRGQLIIDYVGPWKDSFPHYSISTLLKAANDRGLAESLKNELSGARVIVSDLTTRSSDYGPVPFERIYPRSGIHANVLNSLLENRFLRGQYWHETVLLTFLFSIALWLVSWRLGPVMWSVSAIICLVAFTAFQGWLFAFCGIMPRIAPQFIGLVFALVGGYAHRFLRSEREKIAFRFRMERYFAPNLISKIMRSSTKLESAEQKTLTVLFSDIAGFTSWCSAQPPGRIHSTLNEYFEIMTEIVFKNEGTVDKFMGDGMMAFFGDPLDQPDHTLKAVQAAVEMQQRVRELRTRWEPEGGLPVHIRIGIHSGEVVVGNLGSARIMTYTAIGSNVNLCSRLESMAPIDGILVSAAVHQSVKDVFSSRSVGKVSAKGILEDFEAYEILIPAGR